MYYFHRLFFDWEHVIIDKILAFLIDEVVPAVNHVDRLIILVYREDLFGGRLRKICVQP